MFEEFYPSLYLYYTQTDISNFLENSLYYIYLMNQGLEASKEFLRKNLLLAFSFDLFPHRTFNPHILNEYFESVIHQIGNEAIQVNNKEFYCFLNDD